MDNHNNIMIERLNVDETTAYSANEAAIHLARYFIARPFCNGQRVLDVACGEGYGSYLLKEWGANEVVGVDISAEALEKAQQSFGASVDYIEQDVENLSMLEDDSFDLIVSFETIEHLHNPTKFLNEIKRVAKKDGTIIITCPNDYFYYPTPELRNPYHIRKYTLKEYDNLTEEILGKKSVGLLGGALAGYSTSLIDQDESNFTRGKVQKDMLDVQSGSPALKVLPEKVLTPETCCYYASIWNYGADSVAYQSSLVYYVAPIDAAEAVRSNMVFEENIKVLKDYEDQNRKMWESFEREAVLVKETESLRLSLEEAIAHSQTVVAETKEITIELQGTKAELQGAKAELQDRLVKLQITQDELQEATVSLQSIKNEYQFMKDVYLQKDAELENVQTELSQWKQSKTFQYIQKLWHIMDKIKGTS